MLVVGIGSCKNKSEKSVKNPSFTKHIKFNHLYVVIDDTTYDYLFDSLKFLDKFSMNKEMHVDVGDDSWTGKYLLGKHNYLEIFKPGGYEGLKLGGTGLSFMTNQTGTLDSLYSYRNANPDSVTLDQRDFVDEKGDTTSWFRYITIPDKDSLQIAPWLMENTREHMMSLGFTDDDLLHEIEYWDYIKSRIANSFGISPDSVRYDKLFEKVTSLYLTLSQKELNLLKQYLFDFGFTEKDSTFSKDDFEIKYSITESRHFILNQIDFSLSDTIQNQEYSYRNLDLLFNGNKASLKFNYY